MTDLVREGNLQAAAEVLAAERSDGLQLLYFELTKLPLPALASQYRDSQDWPILVMLAAFSARTEEDLQAIEELGVPAVTMTIEALRQALADGPTRELLRQERLQRAEEQFDRMGVFAEGELMGEAKGRAEGMAEGRVETLLEQIAERYGEPEPTPETEHAVRSGTDQQVRDWSLRIFGASTVAELLAGPSGPEGGES